nr:ATP-dependent helicase [Pyrinomonadaceae bacterium]
IFERSEVRDLLAFVALVSDGSGRTLPRVARFPEYDIPLSEVRQMLQAAKEAGREFFELETPDKDTSAPGVARLTHHLKRVAHISSAWKLLAHYLFIHSRYLKPLLADKSVAGAQRRLAIYQLLQFLHNEGERAVEATTDRDARRAILRYVRRLKSFSEDKNLRQVPQSAEDLDAVRLTTVHGAKGLEWSCVYLPHLGRGHFPNRRKHEPCPPPVGMIETFGGEGAFETTEGNDAPGAQTDAHLEEEECLFFVAVSRARDHICFSRAEHYGATGSKASEFLERIEAQLPRSAHGAATWRAEIPDAITHIQLNAASQSSITKPHFTERQLNTYIRCPRKYFYEQRLYLSGRGEEAAYLRFHICVYGVLGWLAGERMAGRLLDGSVAVFQEQAKARLAAWWLEKGLAGHIYETIYREQAALMVERTVRHFSLSRGLLFNQAWTIERPHAFISVTPDYMELIEETNGATILFRHTRTGKPPAKTPDDDVYALYYQIAAEHFPQARPRVEILYLSTDEIIELDLKERTVNTRLKHYDDAISGIIAGEFPPDPSDHQCPQCAHFFTCPKAEP